MTDPLYLGKQSNIEYANPGNVKLDIIPNPYLNADYVARFTIPEFTSLCPQTGQPDFATLVIDYQPHQWLLESKSLKLWMFAFRNHGDFHEKVTVSIGDRFWREVKPHWMRIVGFWYPRGGIPIDVVWEDGTLRGKAAPLDVNVCKPYLGRV